jgi:hypothetical protein
LGYNIYNIKKGRLMKKSTILAFSIVALSCIIQASYDSDRTAQRLSNAAPRAFGSFRMFEKAVNPQGLSEWNTAIADAIEIVRKMNKNSRELQGFIDSILNANSRLIETIKGLYDVVFYPATLEKNVPSSQIAYRWNYKVDAIELLQSVQEKMKNLSISIKESSLLEKEILIELVSYLASYAENAIASVDFKYSTDKKFKASIPEIDYIPSQDYNSVPRERDWMRGRQ